ncbi:MAG: DUF1838 family protein [Chromatiales bacterium]|nr:MAG: DUF1838 family protein [Chromatiales bacterium]
MIHRRRLLQGMGGIAFAAASPLSLSATGLDLSDPRDRLTALAKMRGSTDGSLTIGWVMGARYAVVDKKAIPMLGILAGTFSRYQRLDPDTFEARALEVAYFTDLDTGKLLETWENPVTGKVVEVPQTRMGPSRILMRADGLEVPNPSGEAAGMEIRHRFKDPIQFQGRVWITEEIRVESEPRQPGGKAFRYNEMTTYESRLADLNDPELTAAPVNVQFQSLVTFRRWMGFGDTPGHTTARGFGGRETRVEDLPPYYLELTERYHADVLNDPIAALGISEG